MELREMIELTDAELDHVAAGAQNGLVNVNVSNNNRLITVDRNDVEVIKNAIVVVDVL